jgi:hypothetical protein
MRHIHAMTSTALPQLADIQVKCMVKKCLQAVRDGSFAKATFSQIHKANLIALVFHMAVRGDGVDGSKINNGQSGGTYDDAEEDDLSKEANLVAAAEAAEAAAVSVRRQAIDDMSDSEVRDALFATQTQPQTQPGSTPAAMAQATPAPPAGATSRAGRASQPPKPVCPTLTKGKFCGGCKGFRHPRICYNPLHAVPRS